jgi:hypothetical protein
MTAMLLRRWRAVLIMAWCAVGSLPAHSFTPMDLQRLLQSGAQPAVKFQDVRESPWLANPIRSSGTLRSTPDGLEKRVDVPRSEVWRLLADRVEWQSADGAIKQLKFTEMPALAPLSDVMRHVISGNIAAVQKDFDVQVSGDSRVWRALLKPRTPAVQRQLELVELQGTGSLLQVIIVVERQGERTTTRLQH